MADRLDTLFQEVYRLLRDAESTGEPDSAALYSSDQCPQPVSAGHAPALLRASVRVDTLQEELDLQITLPRKRNAYERTSMGRRLLPA